LSETSGVFPHQICREHAACGSRDREIPGRLLLFITTRSRERGFFCELSTFSFIYPRELATRPLTVSAVSDGEPMQSLACNTFRPARSSSVRLLYCAADSG